MGAAATVSLLGGATLRSGEGLLNSIGMGVFSKMSNSFVGLWRYILYILLCQRFTLLNQTYVPYKWMNIPNVNARKCKVQQWRNV